MGSPATNFAQEREFIRRALELEHGLRAEEATEAFLEPLRRLLEEADRARRSEDQDIERNTRLQLRIFLEADQVVVRVLDRDGEPLGHWSGREGPSPEHCERMMREALKGQPARPNEWVVIRAQKEVSFKVVKCALNGLARAGFGKKVHFEPWR